MCEKKLKTQRNARKKKLYTDCSLALFQRIFFLIQLANEVFCLWFSEWSESKFRKLYRNFCNFNNLKCLEYSVCVYLCLSHENEGEISIKH